ncbi:atpF [Symbiodinium sp. CCMP2592]|nr:atpF [Symbiodinium sp. CCMP2592]
MLQILVRSVTVMGLEIEPNELEAMIALVDMKETGSATYEDFAAVFGNPAETLRQINVEAVKAASRGEVREKKLLDLRNLDEESEEEEPYDREPLNQASGSGIAIAEENNEEGQDDELELEDDGRDNG